MVILAKKFGRLANRLWIFSYFAANAIEYDYKLLYRNFDEFIRYFPACNKNQFGGYKIRARISRFLPLDYFLYWVFQIFIEIINKFDIQFGKVKIIRIKIGIIFDLKQEKFIEGARKDLIFIRNGGFHYQDQENLMKHSEKIRKFFEPDPKYRHNVANLFNREKLPNHLLVGVHLRKYDYKRFLGGKLFFSDDTYLKNIQLIGETLSEKSHQVQFLICSDEPIEAESFTGINYFTGTGHLIEDLYAFSKCDYIIGPPSTYTAWASFFGNVPTCFISPATKSIDVNDFKVINDINMFYEHVIYCEQTENI
jgi:hypothetical protein